MALLTMAQEAEIHRAAYRALLQGVLHQPGRKQQVARQAGISVQYLSYVLHDARVLGVATAERIAAAVPLEAAERQQLLTHVQQASECRLRCFQALTTPDLRETLPMHLVSLRQMHDAASFARDASRSYAQLRGLYAVGRRLLPPALRTQTPLDVVELCLLLHDTASMIHQQVDALYYAQIARHVLTAQNRWEGSLEERARWDQLEINAIRAEAVAYHNLARDRDAVICCAEAETTRAMRHQPADWIPHVYRDKINALCGQPRFAIREAEAYADTVRAWCDRRSDPAAPLQVLMIERSLAQAYLRYGNVRKARRLLQDPSDRLAQMPVVGPLHQTLVLSTTAQACWHAGDRTEWAAYITATLQVATAAGLTHQLRKLQQTYGEHLQPWMDALVVHGVPEGQPEARPDGPG